LEKRTYEGLLHKARSPRPAATFQTVIRNVRRLLEKQKTGKSRCAGSARPTPQEAYSAALKMDS
jgi:translation elongation factor EF-4